MITAKGHTGTVEFDGTYITIVRKGFLARASVGKGEKRIPLASLTAVQWKPAGAMVNGYIEFSLGGGNETKSRFGKATTDAAHNENAVVFTKSQMPAFAHLRSAIEQAQAEHWQQSQHPALPAQPTGNDLARSIGELAALHQQGVLSDQEFADAKQRLIAG
jgi:Domain of unknown function (DUF4429)